MTSSQHGIFAGAKPEYRVLGGIEPWAWRAREREPITEPLVEGQGREPPLAENLLAIGCATEAANLPHSVRTLTLSK